MKSIIHTAAACFCILALPLSAQEKSVRIDLMPIGLGAPFAAWYLHKGQPKKLEAYETAMGSPVFYHGSRQLLLFAEEVDLKPRPEGQPPAVPLATVNLPEGCRRALLLCATPTPDAKTVVRSYGIADYTLQAGDYRFFNFTSANVVGIVGGKKIALKPGGTVDVSDAGLREKGKDLEVQLGYLKDGKSVEVYSTIWGHSAARRSYIFVVGSENPDQPLEVCKFHDVPGVESVGYEKEVTAAAP